MHMINRFMISMQIAWRRTCENAWQALADEDGIGTVEMILILVVLIGLVLIFKEKLTSLVEDIFEKITSQSSSV